MTDAVFAVSDSTMLDLIRWYGDLARGCQVAGPKLVLDGVCDDVPNAGDREDFALYVGSMLPHKNVSTIVRAFQERSSKDDGTPSELLLVGPNYAGEVDEVMNGSGPRVRHLGFVSDDELNELYRKARVLLFPSIFEGFGLPLVEAVAAGTPCIVSDLAVFRDIGREAVAAYVDHPLDPIAWREAIRNISGSPVMSGHVDWTPSATAVAETFKSIVR
ncbi:MAG: glycosyltransferase family 4 protein [Acidipropionibacterium sp.]|jgi:glycosyltransferase involved in cell wall biosynthesis|nr:glycosyltransferase family 4 protein [Acidipropionibacterium sp.]